MLAEELGINPNTVQRAYQLLEDNQYIETILKKGVYVKYNKSNNLEKYNNIKQDLLKIKENGKVENPYRYFGLRK